MNSKECLDLAILEYEKETVYDENNQWVKNVLKGLKEVKQDLDRLEQLKKAIGILKHKFEIIICKNIFPITATKHSIGFKINNDGVWAYLAQEDCELLEEVFTYE